MILKWSISFNGYASQSTCLSFNKFPGVDISLGPEMKSTGEAIYFIKDLYDPYFRDPRQQALYVLSAVIFCNFFQFLVTFLWIETLINTLYSPKVKWLYKFLFL